ncbi:hypothetical protein BC830DRAFT_438242 [Chytriomyces sp. MP71]|nr:hypothetical protein BC830DRAFT_438242 [Chytriomyces sp. MP71]
MGSTGEVVVTALDVIAAFTVVVVAIDATTLNPRTAAALLSSTPNAAFETVGAAATLTTSSIVLPEDVVCAIADVKMGSDAASTSAHATTVSTNPVETIEEEVVAAAETMTVVDATAETTPSSVLVPSHHPAFTFVGPVTAKIMSVKSWGCMQIVYVG